MSGGCRMAFDLLRLVGWRCFLGELRRGKAPWHYALLDSANHALGRPLCWIRGAHAQTPDCPGWCATCSQPRPAALDASNVSRWTA